MGGFNRILEIQKENARIAEEEEQERLAKCAELQCGSCSKFDDCDITWRRMGACCD